MSHKSKETQHRVGTYFAHNKWWYKEPKTLTTHGPFEKREAARMHGRSLKVREMDERPPTQIPMATAH